jgi:Leucine Rich repeat
MLRRIKKQPARYIHDEEKLDLHGKKIGAKQAKAIAEELAVNTSLTFLNLSDNTIGDDGTAAIANALRANKSLEMIDLGSNGIGNVGMVALAQALVENNSLRFLWLSGSKNNMGTVGMEALTGALKVNSGLTMLCLSYSSLGDPETVILAEALRFNKTISMLNLRSNNIGNTGARAILDALKYNSTLESIDLDVNFNIASTIFCAIEDIVSANRAKTRSVAVESGTPTAELLHNNAPSVIDPTGPPMAAVPPEMMTPPASAATSLESSSSEKHDDDALRAVSEWHIALPTQRAELELELGRLVAVRDSCLHIPDEDQWQRGIYAEKKIHRVQRAIASGQFPTSKELQSMINALVSDIKQTAVSDSLAAAAPLRKRLAQLREDLVREREAEARVQVASDKRAANDLLETGRRAVLEALCSTDSSVRIGPIPVEYLTSISSNWTELVGRGGFGEVFKGRDATSGLIVAIKKIPNDRLHDQERSQFKNEIEVRR